MTGRGDASKGSGQFRFRRFVIDHDDLMRRSVRLLQNMPDAGQRFVLRAVDRNDDVENGRLGLPRRQPHDLRLNICRK
jgi:hypothetical protein